MPRDTDRREFGSLDRLASGRYRARYRHDGGRHTSPITFDDKDTAREWLRRERRLIEDDPLHWTPPKERYESAREAQRVAAASRLPTFGEYATRWIAERKNGQGEPLAENTAHHYRNLLRDYLDPTFGPLPLDAITPEMVNLWYDTFSPKAKKWHGKKVDGRTTRAHTYSFARAVMNSATGAHGPIVGRVNPFAVRGGGSSPGKKRNELVTAEELTVILEHIRPEWRAVVLLAIWCGLRFGELAELRRTDIDLTNKVVHVRRAVGRSGGVHVKAPKSAAGSRTNPIPDHVLPEIRAHLNTYVTGRGGLLFPGRSGQHLAPATFYGKPGGNGWYGARQAADRTDLHFHDLRATGATLLAQQGATEAEIQAWLGDSTPQAAQRYVRAARSRMKMLSERLSELAKGGGW